jgi:hypothetical protein
LFSFFNNLNAAIRAHLCAKTAADTFSAFFKTYGLESFIVQGLLYLKAAFGADADT